MTVKIECFYKKIDGVVYLFRRIGDGEWESIETPHKEEPIVEFKHEER